MTTEAERVKSLLSEMVRNHHKGEPPEHIRYREEVLFAMLDSTSDVIAETLRDVPDARIFSRETLRAFLASVVADVILRAGKRVLLTKGR